MLERLSASLRSMLMFARGIENVLARPQMGGVGLIRRVRRLAVQ
jgi:hypothetical protein